MAFLLDLLGDFRTFKLYINLCQRGRIVFQGYMYLGKHSKYDHFLLSLPYRMKMHSQ